MASRRCCATIDAMPAQTSARIRLVLAYDGSEIAADAIRVAGRFFPGADALVVHHRDQADIQAQAALARTAMPSAATIHALRDYERTAVARARELAEAYDLVCLTPAAGREDPCRNLSAGGISPAAPTQTPSR